MSDQSHKAFDPLAYLANAGPGRRIIVIKPRQTIFSQGDMADSVFYLQKGRAKLTVVSKSGKEATLSFLAPGEFAGEECLATIPGRRLSTAVSITTCTALEIRRTEMMRVIHEEHEFSALFLKFLLARSIRTRADLVDHLFNSSEKRLARILLLMAQFGQAGEESTSIPPVTQETLAGMVGTTRSRISYFMNRFRDHGYLDYNGRGIQVHKSLLNVLLHDQIPERDTENSKFVEVA